MNINLDRAYENVVARLERGEPVDLDILATLDDAGYELPDYEGDDDGEAEAENEVSPNEVTISFTDFNHGTAVDVMVDSDGDIWLSSEDTTLGSAILLSRAGAGRLFNVLDTILNDD